jgi:hypothetical protein
MMEGSGAVLVTNGSGAILVTNGSGCGSGSPTLTLKVVGNEN